MSDAPKPTKPGQRRRAKSAGKPRSPKPVQKRSRPNRESVKKRSRPDRGEGGPTPERPARQETASSREAPQREEALASATTGASKKHRQPQREAAARSEPKKKGALQDSAPRHQDPRPPSVPNVSPALPSQAADPSRRALSHQGGPTQTDGDSDASEILSEAFTAAAGESADTLTHGVHGYPARMHPAIARVLLDRLTRPDDQLLDPFCGSGTTLVEARAAGVLAAGVDLNPIALRLAEVKTAVRDAPSRERFTALLGDLARRSERRVRDREPVVAPVPRHHVRWYAGHVLKELGGLWEEIQQLRDEADRRAFEIVLSSVVMKFSYRRSESDASSVIRTLRKGLVTEHFHRRGLGLVERWADLERAAPADSPEPWLVEGDARRLPQLLGQPPRADLVITSPPYGGTYDYVTHHELRYPWLGLDASNLERYEVGARRNLNGVGGAGRWERELNEVLRSLAGVIVQGGVAVFLVGDAQVGEERVQAGRQLRKLAPRAGFNYIASASQRRPDFTGHGTRGEHLVLLERQSTH